MLWLFVFVVKATILDLEFHHLYEDALQAKGYPRHSLVNLWTVAGKDQLKIVLQVN